MTAPFRSKASIDEEFGELVAGCYEPTAAPEWSRKALTTPGYKASPRYPGGFWRPAGANIGSNGGPKAFSWHTAITNGGGDAIGGWVSSSSACQAYIERRGAFYQYMDFDRACYGTLDGNFNGVVTIETWDGLPVATATENDVNRDPWPDQMVERIADVIAFANLQLGIPIQRLHRTDSRGHGPHRTGISRATTNLRNGNVYEGPGRWSSSTSKPCCGDKRLVQLYGPNMDGGQGSILARAAVLSAGISAGAYGHIPPGDVDLNWALSRGGSAGPTQFTSGASLEQIAEAARKAYA